MKSIIISCILLFSFVGLTQNQDAVAWTGISLSKSITDKFSFEYKTQTRFNNNMSSLATYLNQVCLDYEFSNNFSADIKYRFSIKQGNNYHYNMNRFMLDFKYKYKIKPANLKLGLRLRFQNEFDRMFPVDEYILPSIENAARLKLTLKYSIPDVKIISPFVGYEGFNTLDAQNEFIDRNRFFGGFDFDFKKGHGLKFNYIYQISYGSTMDINHIYTLQYSYNLNKLF